MKNDYKDDKFQELLNKLQQESWQLELLISGFAIYGLFSSLGFITEAQNSAIATESYSKYLYPLATISCKVLMVNLIIHVILRGLWIGAIGLRYVSGDIDYDYLNYKKRFKEHLKKKVGSFDKYIGTLENYCSILFAVTFLSLFYIISLFTIFFIIILSGGFFIDTGIFSEFTGMFFFGIFIIFFLSLSLLVFIDFITQGYLKKIEWISFLYFPIYKIFTIITLSFLYRPLVYNLLDNKFGKRLLYILFPIYMLAFFVTTIQNIRSNYISIENNSSVYYSSPNNYFDSLEENQFVKKAAINSKMIDKPFVKVFIPFRKKIENIMLEQYQDLKPKEDIRGYRSDFFSSKKVKSERDSLRIKYLKVFKETYSLKIDSLTVVSDFIITDINNQLGFETIISLNTISEGLHNLTISRYITSKETKTSYKENIIEIPFWYYTP